ncbi:hypothetical protein MesoLjLc_20380 [Mesorhizobium sp. L-8-10]|nr:hypothetical protein MesoLjLc_20380 [Mesorhizobium sp. L-8-10]
MVETSIQAVSPLSGTGAAAAAGAASWAKAVTVPSTPRKNRPARAVRAGGAKGEASNLIDISMKAEWRLPHRPGADIRLGKSGAETAS